MNKHMPSIQIIVEAEDVVLVEAVVEADLITSNRINKIRATQKIQVVAKEEEIKEAGEVQEEEVVGSKEKAIILMHVGFVADMVTLQMTVINDSTIRDKVDEISKKTTHLLQTMTVMVVYLLCSI